MATPSVTIQNKDTTKMSMKSLVGKRITKKVKFMGEDLTINKLTVDEVMDIQVKAKSIEGNEEKGFEVLMTVIRSGAEGASELSDEDFKGFPMDELSKLSNEIMAYSGLGESGK